ncbi:thioesterase II family protein [Alteromonas sp. ASW11-130]|uniref:thioesterase II family protein n=1 Tax=Alteromonas sp. ASW11-130 TaxID=3015775 RepID=UPI002241B692|nr:thioesterase domain-containing protein [Alteromonas sp. ASW11-130]MCW8092486.1 thioesterase domain-containing protein [Alteromonas sp. ASW11-130]
MNINNLFVIPKPVSNPKVRLFCFPFAGGSISTYIPWIEQFSSDIEFVLIQPPGRGVRIAEPPHNCMGALVSEILEHKKFVTKTPYIVFGHSLGSRVAYELCRQLNLLEMPLPEYFIASGSRAPHISSDKPHIHGLPKNDFIKELEQLNGTPKELLENKELMDLFIPLLRADFKIAETYMAQEAKMPFPILVLHGREDVDIDPHQIAGWQDLSCIECTLVQLPGDHFFINEFRNEVIKQVSLVVEKSLAVCSDTVC